MKDQNLKEAKVRSEQPEAPDNDLIDSDLADNDLNDLIDVETIDIDSALEEFDPDTDDESETSEERKTDQNPPGQKRSVFPYIIIAVLAVSLCSLGILTFMSLDRLASLQSRISQLQQTVKDISDSASTLSQKAEELKRLQEEEESMAQSITDTPEQTAEIQGPQKPAISEEAPSEEGTLSPGSGSETFTNNTDESMDSLLAQIEPLLPQNNGTWSVYVCNLMKGSEGTIGGGRMQAASLIKLFIMGTVYENYDSLAQLHGKDSLDGYIRSMITVSDNDAANTLINWLGSGDDANGMTMVNDFCNAHGYTETSMGRLLLQSNENGDNYTSVRDCGRFLKEVYEINAGTAANAALSHADSMYYLLKLQERVNKIPAQLPEGVHTANKTGELSNVENDAGIIFDTAKGIDLVVCFMSENLTDTAAAQASIAQNARLIYGYYNE
ncbi:MAG: serine hydrolase [Eubacteriales bacterium]|nr:serine hydrolase [Eubacteriales bacterium]